MYTVSLRAKTYKQPRGGFISPKSFEEYEIFEFEKLYDEENISPSIVGTVVDYMTRFILNDNKEEAFKISLMGAERLSENDLNKAKKLLENINGLDNGSLTNACKLVGYDTVLRAGAHTYRPIEEINPDSKTLFNILIMIKRSEEFFHEYGPLILDGFSFLGGYNKTVISGDADFLTEDTIWDFKVSKNGLKSAQTLQLYMYYLMGCRTIKLNAEYDFKNKIKKLGFFNPRLSKVYIKNISTIDEDTKAEVESEVIGYKDKEIDPHLKMILEKMTNKK